MRKSNHLYTGKFISNNRKTQQSKFLDVSCKNLITNNTYLSYSFIDNQLQIMMIAVKIFIGITAFQFFLASMACIPGLRTSRGDLRGDGKKTIVKSSLFKGLLNNQNCNEIFNDNLILFLIFSAYDIQSNKYPTTL